MNDVQKMVEENLPFIKYCIWVAFGRRSRTPIPQFLGVAAERFLLCAQAHKPGAANIRTYSMPAVVGAVRIAARRERCVVKPTEYESKNEVLRERNSQARAGWVSIFERRGFGRRLSRVVDDLKSSDGVAMPHERDENAAEVDELLRYLTARERAVISLRFGLDDGNERTLGEVGEMLSVTRERVRQIEAKAIRRLQDAVRFVRIARLLMGTK